MAEWHQKFVGEELPIAAAHSGNNARGLGLWVMGLWGLSRSAMMTIFALTPRERIPMSLMMLAAPAASVQR